MPNRYLPIRFMNAVEQLDSKLTHKLEAEMPEYQLEADTIFYERILVLLPNADETHIERWEKSLGVLPSSQDLEERRNYLMILISQKIKPSIKTLEEMSYQMTGLHAQISMAIPKRLKYGAYFSNNPVAGEDESDYFWFDGDRIRNIGTLKLNYESEGTVKAIGNYFTENIFRDQIYKVYDDTVTEGFVWMLGNTVLDKVEEVTIDGVKMYKATYGDQFQYVSSIQQKFANIAFADERTSTLLPNPDFGEGNITGKNRL